MKYRLVGGKKRVVGIAFIQLRTLLIHSEVHIWSYRRKNVQTVLQSNFHPVFCGFLLKPLHIVNEVCVFEIEAVVVLL